MSIFQNTMLAGSATQFFPYEIDQSIRFNDDDSAHMNRIFGAGGTPKTFTTGCWFKVASFGDVRGIINSEDNSGSALDDFIIRLSAADKLEVIYKNTSNTQKIYWTSDFVLRDPAAWYFVAVTCDTTPATPIFKVFCSASGTSNWDCDSVMTKTTDSLAQNDESSFLSNSNEAHIGAFYNAGAGNYFDGYMAEIFIQDGVVITDPFTDGYVEIDENGVYKPLNLSGKTFGTQGGLYLGSNSADLGADDSGNGNDFTSSGLTAADQVSDSPTDNFPTLNSIFDYYTSGNTSYFRPNFAVSLLSEGNLKLDTNSPNTPIVYATQSFPLSGKFYFEVTVNPANAAVIGIGGSKNIEDGIGASSTTAMANVIGYYNNGTLFNQSSTASAYGNASSIADGEYVGVAVDIDNDAIWFCDNGTWVDGDGTDSSETVLAEIEAGTTTSAAATNFLSDQNSWYPMVAAVGDYPTFTTNFGQSSFTGAAPAGFTNLSTANLPDPTIALPEKYFNTVLYEGNGGGQRVGQFQPITETYSVPNSVIFNDNDSASLTRTPSSAGDRRTFTFSCWVKRASLTGANQPIFSAGGDDWLMFLSAETLGFNTSGSNYRIVTNQVFKDTSTWFHVVLRVDTTNATAGDRLRLYINGSEITDFGTDTNPTLNFETAFNNTGEHQIGKLVGASQYFDGYLAEINHIDGQSLGPDSFGQLDASTNRWIPKDTSGLTFGTNGFYLDMETAPGTGSGAGTDSSGNSNNFTESGLAASDQVTDSPTENFCVLDANQCDSGDEPSDGNLKLGVEATNIGTIGVTSGKWYWECTCNATNMILGITNDPGQTHVDAYNDAWGYQNNGNKYYNSTTAIGSYGSTYTVNDVISVALDLDNGAIWFAKNGTWQASATVDEIEAGTTTNAAFNSGFTGTIFPWFYTGGTGQLTANFGQKAFSYTPPTGFAELNNDNLPLSNGDLSAFVWIKNRDATDNHMLFNAVRGPNIDQHSNSTAAEATNANTLTRFLKNGFEVSNDPEVNTSGESYVAWQWLTDSLTISANGDGSTSTSVIANTTSGFSIATYPGTGANATVGHGLGVAPSFVLVKAINDSHDWYVWTPDLATTEFLKLNTTAAKGTSSPEVWNSTAPTSSVVSLGTSIGVNRSGYSYVMYCFAEVEGFSKFTSYEGNASTDGPFIHCGFRPSFVMIKNADAAEDWWIQDAAREPFNGGNMARLAPNSSAVEADNVAWFDFVSNGLKVRYNAGGINSSGTHIVMAFAESPFKTATAR